MCVGCQRLSLVQPTQCQTETVCRACGAELRVVPSCSHSETDVALFEEVVSATASLDDPLEAARLLIEVERALASGSSQSFLAALSDRWLGLTPLVTVTGGNRDAQTRILRILKTILIARASTRRSGTMQQVGSTDTATTQAPARRKA